MRLIYVALAWCTGILLAPRNEGNTPLSWLITALLFIGALFLFRRRWRPRLIILLALVAAFGGLRFALTPPTAAIAAYNSVGGLSITGTVANDPVERGSGLRFLLDASSVTRAGQTHATSGLILVDTPFGFSARYGDQITATGELFTPPSFDTFSYADFLARSGVFSQMPHAAIEHIDAPDEGNPLTQRLIDLRDQASQNINQVLPEPYAGLLNGTLLGDESGIAPEIEDSYAATGAAHVVAISGYNMVVISGVLLALLGKTRLPRSAQAWIVLGIIALYTVFVGASAAVVRAAVMSGLMIVGERIVRRRTFVPASLAFAVLIMSMQNPYVLWDVGFQLSLFATLGIVLFTRPMTRWAQQELARWLPANRAEIVATWLEAALFVSIAAQALTLPLIALYFERLSLVSLPVNLLIAPVQPFVLIVGGAAVLVSFLSSALAQPLFLGSLLPLAWTTSVVRSAAVLPFADVAVRIPPNAASIFFALIVGGAMLHATQPEWLMRAIDHIRRRPVFVGTCAVGCAVLVFLVAIILSRPDGRLHLWLLDMGHSHAVLIQSPSGTHTLIDGGRFPSRLLLALGDRLPFNDRTLETVIITQPDEFDYSALPDVFGRYAPQVIITNDHENPGRAYTALQAAWGSTPVTTLTAGYSIQLDNEMRLEILHPLRVPQPVARLNDSSLVLRLSYRDFSVVIPGDASQAAQAEVVSSGVLLQSDVLVLPQHGTVASLNDDFLAAIAPEVIFLQADAANRLGDPNEDTLLKLGDTRLYRTDESGTIHLVSDGFTYDVSYDG